MDIFDIRALLFAFSVNIFQQFISTFLLKNDIYILKNILREQFKIVRLSGCSLFLSRKRDFALKVDQQSSDMSNRSNDEP